MNDLLKMPKLKLNNKSIKEVDINVNSDSVDKIPQIKSKIAPSDTISVGKKSTPSTAGMTNPAGIQEIDTTTSVDGSGGDTSAGAAQPTNFGTKAVSDIVNNFYSLLDKNEAVVSAANRIRTPEDKIAAIIEFVKRLQLPKAVAGKVKMGIDGIVVESNDSVTETINPKMSKKELIDLVNNSKKLKIVETIKVNRYKK